MIDVKRYNFSERKGDNKVVPTYYHCYYYYDGIEIAWYMSKYDIIYIKADYISNDNTMSNYQRALNGQYKTAYGYLFDMLNVNEKTTLICL